MHVLKWAISALCIVACGPVLADDILAPVQAQDSFLEESFALARNLGIDEIRVGGTLSNLELVYYLVPDLSSLTKARLDAVQFDVLFRTPEPFAWLGTLRPAIGGVINLEGYESLVHVGVDYQVHVANSPVYVEAGLGLGIHNGYLRAAPAGYHNEGCRALAHWEAGVGADLGDDVTVTLEWQHMSGFIFGCRPNDGLNHVGLVLGKRF